MQSTGVNSLAASRCCAPILRRMYPSANPTAEDHAETMARTTNNDLSFATNVRKWNVGYVIRHSAVRIAIREKIGLSNPRNSGFGCGDGLLVYWEFVTDDGSEFQAGSSGYNSPPLGVGRTGSIWSEGVAKPVVGGRLELSLMRTLSMLRVENVRGRERRGPPTFVPSANIAHGSGLTLSSSCVSASGKSRARLYSRLDVLPLNCPVYGSRSICSFDVSFGVQSNKILLTPSTSAVRLI